MGSTRKTWPSLGTHRKFRISFSHSCSFQSSAEGLVGGTMKTNLLCMKPPSIKRRCRYTSGHSEFILLMMDFLVAQSVLDGAQIKRADTNRAEATRAHNPLVLLDVFKISDSQVRAGAARLTDDPRPSSLRLSLQRGRRRSSRNLKYPPSPPSWPKRQVSIGPRAHYSEVRRAGLTGCYSMAR